jgi:hypothetical protein
MTSLLNNWSKRVHIHVGLVSNQTNVAFNGWSVSTSEAQKSTGTQAYTSKSYRLDDVVADPVLFAKIDVEGWEPSVFESATKLIAERPPRYITFEITYYLFKEWNIKYIDTVAHLYQHGYRCAQLNKHVALPSISSRADAERWFEGLKPDCNTDKVKYCQDDVYCLHRTAGYIPEPLKALFA